MTKILNAALTMTTMVFLGVGGVGAQIIPKLPAPGEAPAGSPVAKYGWLKAEGGYLRGSVTGTTNIQLKGMSLFWSNGGDGGRVYYNEGVIAWLAHDWQIDVVRAAMGTKNDEGGGNPGYCETDSSGQVNLVRNVVEASIKRGLYVIIDFHSHFADQYPACSQKFFRDMVNLYGKYPNVIYEIYNEPKGTDWNAYKTYSNQVISTIRSTETSAGVTNKNLVVVGTPSWSSQPNVSGDVTDAASNVAYSLHFYAGSPGHDGYRGNATSAKNSGRTVFVTEFGTCDASGNGGYNAANTDTWLETLSTNKMSWVNWAVSNKDETAAILKHSATGTSGGWSAGDLSTSGAYIRGKFPSGNRGTYTVTLTQPTGGAITKEPSGSGHAYSSSIKVKAVPASGWELQNWTGDGSGNAEELSGTVNGINLNFSAVFYNGGLVKNGHFTYGITSWNTNNSTNLALTMDNNQLKAAVSVAGAAGDLRVTQTGIKLEKGHKYSLSFKARGQSARSITPRITNNTSTRDYMGNTPLSLTTTMTELKRDFVSDTTIANAILRFDCGDAAVAWFMDDVKLLDEGGGYTGVMPFQWTAAPRTAWSVSNIGGNLTLRGPVGVVAKITLFDTRGKVIKSLNAKDGMTIGAGIPVGNYIAVVKNAAGREVFRAKLSIVR